MTPVDPLYLVSLAVSWGLVLVGFGSGALIGLQFHKTDWLGGYGSFARRLLRLGHIACFGLPLLNTNLVLLYLVLRVEPSLVVGPVVLWIVGQLAMPTICFLSAWRPWFRHAFFVPVSALILGTLWLFWVLFRA